MQRAEKDRQIIEEKVKLWKTPVGLARPVQPKINPLVTHRGRGAFCNRDFLKKSSDTEPPSTEESPTESPTKKDMSDDTFDENSERERSESDRSKNNNENETRFENATDDRDNKYDRKEESNVAAEKKNGDEDKTVNTDDADISLAKAKDNTDSGVSNPQDKYSSKTNVNNSYLGDTKTDLDTKIAQELANFERKTEDQEQNLPVKDNIGNGTRDNHDHKETDQKLDTPNAGDQAEVNQETKDVNCNDKLESKPDIGPDIS